MLARIKELSRLAAPTILSRSGMIVMALVDTVMLGRFAATELAYQSIAAAVTIPLFVTPVGLVIGTAVMTARAMGRGEPAEAGAAWRRGAAYAVGLGLIGLALTFAAEPFLRLTGQSERLAVHGGEVARILGLGLPFMLLFTASGMFLEGLKRPVAPMWVMLGANLLNIVLNWLWIYGHLGFAAHGAIGSAWATTSVRIAMAAGLVVYVWRLRDAEALAVRRRASGGWRDWAHQRRIGYGAGGSQALETVAFSAQSVIAGLLGAAALAAYSISFQILALVFMTALGFGSATSVLVGHAWGRGDTPEMARAGWTGLGLNTVVMAALGVVIFFGAPWLARGFAAEPSLIDAATPLIAFVAFVLVADGGQAVLAHALRGRGETWVPMALHAISYVVILLPLSVYLALHTGRGAMGILEAILIASIVAVALLAARFQWLAKRDARASG